ncbi:hypothetical protein TNCV_2741371 [Trichonephila clavipes]|nr:hypothetical protein TNCV_2741371 [Trichonephila clavipes]
MGPKLDYSGGPNNPPIHVTDSSILSVVPFNNSRCLVLQWPLRHPLLHHNTSSRLKLITVDPQTRKQTAQVKPQLPYESGPRLSTKCFIDFHPGARLAQETATQKFVDYPDPLVRDVALATVFGIVEWDLLKNLMNRGTRLVNRCFNTTNTSAADDIRYIHPLLQHTLLLFLAESSMIPLLQISESCLIVLDY